MKNKLIAFGLALTLVLSLTGAAIAAGGSQADPLISRNYLESTYLTALSEKINGWLKEKKQPELDEAKSRLEKLAAGYLSDLGATSGSLPEGWVSTKDFTVGGGERKDVISLASGSSLQWTSGSAVADQILVDVTAGYELAVGGELIAGHRYLTTEQTSVTVASRVAHWAVQGVWHTTSDGIHVTEISFSDIPEDSWYCDAVYYAVSAGLFNGTSDTTFSPMMTMQRCMLTTVLYRLAGSPSVEYTDLFSDVPAGNWYSDGTVWAGQNKVVNGTGDGRFLPQDNIARQQIAVILYNYAGFIGRDTELRGDLTGFSDEGSIAGWARDAVSWAVAVGILKGSNEKVMPENYATRAEVAIMMQRFLDWTEQ